MKGTKEAVEIKKTLSYQADRLFNACENVKDEFMKAYGKPFLVICDYLNRIISTIKQYKKD